MSFEFGNPLQCYERLDKCHQSLCEGLKYLAEQSDSTRLLCPLAGVLSLALGINKMIVALVEPIFKGLANLVCAPFLEEANALRGLLSIVFTPVIVAKTAFDDMLNKPVIVFARVLFNPSALTEEYTLSFASLS
jgi:hypothetical protein